jgi:hypothetical protein
VLHLILVMTLQQHRCVMFLAPKRQVTNVRPSRNSPHQAVIPRDTPEYQCPWFQFYRASNFYCMTIAAELSLPSGPPLAVDWAAVSVTVASEMTRHAPGAVWQAGGDKLQRCRAAAAAAVTIATTKRRSDGHGLQQCQWQQCLPGRWEWKTPVISPVRVL